MQFNVFHRLSDRSCQVVRDHDASEVAGGPYVRRQTIRILNETNREAYHPHQFVMASLRLALKRHTCTISQASASRAVLFQPTRAYHPNALPTLMSLEDEFDIKEVPEFDFDDATGVGHHLLRQQREYLQYFRLIEGEIPKLQAYRQAFVPPKEDQKIIHRSLWYAGEPQPVERKAVLVIPISALPLASPAAVHKFKLIAGPRWSLDCPKDAGFGGDEAEKLGKEGFIKISCEDADKWAVNLRWCSNVLDKMVTEANKTKGTQSFEDVPLDTRHMEARAKKHRKGAHHTKRAPRTPTIKDFPKEWLPQRFQDTSASQQPSSSS
ncbi:hypothetical protein FRC02_007720 [Tulasnella sp. 418]|nr:hypothetical protein FRC02_007720 [Tulasnella sp. 418]